jgi:hypothetical protein
VRNQIIKILFLLTIFLFSCKKDATAPDFDLLNYKLDDNVSIKVGVYLDNGVFDVCRTNTINMMNEMHCNYTAITRDSIMNGSLNHYNLLLMPGGDMWTYGSYLSNTGITKIKDYIRQGGGIYWNMRRVLLCREFNCLEGLGK